MWRVLLFCRRWSRDSLRSFDEVLERSGSRRRSRVAQRRQDFVAPWCAPTPEVCFNISAGGGEAGRLFTQRRQRKAAVHPSVLDSRLWASMCQADFESGVQIVTLDLFLSLFLTYCLTSAGSLGIFKAVPFLSLYKLQSPWSFWFGLFWQPVWS